ncbi:penicillin-binding protein [Erysipelotrichaceae bacterium OttesenSCG-928-M19]|nr:penicillin-binding protein [Erysipelotrichaceae bacterium OttesenSCG-928-M19]
MKKRNIKKKTKKSLPIKILDIFLNISFFGCLILGGYFIYSYTQLPALEVDNMIRPNDSYVYDRKDRLIGTISRKKENQENISYNAMNQSIINTLVGTEDSTFFTHKGIDIINTAESALKSVTGTVKSGGSSITQQIIGWSHLDRNERTVSRKVKEILLAFKVEREIDKSEIMELYLNYFFYGKNNIHGIEKASEFFFNRNAYELDVVQSALMTGTLNSPSTYNPLGTYDSATKTYTNYSKNRLDNVLLANKNQGYIPTSEYFLLQQVQVENTVEINDITKSNKYNSYIDLVRREMEDKYKVDLTTTSTKIYTNMDVKAQKHADNIIKGKIAGAELPEKDMNFGFVLSDTQTGAIRAVGGGKQYRKGGSMLLNNAIDLKQQPGSAFKPIIDYAPTFEFLHWPNKAPISNAAMKYPGTNTSIRNYDGTTGGVMTMDKAIATSRNLTAVRAMEAVVNKVGFDGLNKYLTALGFDFKDSELAYAYALGGTKTGVSPVQMNGAYQAFGNGGYYIEPWTIRYYTNEDTGKKIVNPTKPVQAIDKRTSFMISNTLETSTKSSGLLAAANFGGIPYAAKTGTSNWGTEGAQYGIPNLSPKDSWFSGYTSRYTLSVWSGYDAKGIKKGKYPAWGRQHDYAAIIWGSMMRKMSNGKEKSYLNAKVPEGIVQSSFDPKTPAPFKFPAGSGDVGYFYTDNLPSGTAKPNVEESDFVITASYSNGKLTVSFKDVDVTGVKQTVKIGSKTANSGGTYNMKEGQAFTAYYTYDGKIYGTISGCVKNNKLTTKC